MGILDDLAAHDIIDRERDLALTTAERDRDAAKELLAAEQLAHADTRATLQETSLSLAAVTAERDLLQQRLDICEANGSTDPTGPTSADLQAAWGVGTHPNFVTAPAWSDPDAWMAEVVAIGFTQIRGMFNPNNSGCKRTLELCKQHGVRWLMTLVPEDWSVTPAQAAARIKWLKDNGYGEVPLAFEGPNEPAHERSGGAPPADWAERTLAAQKAIHGAARLHFPGLPVLSPAMHDVQEDSTNGAGYKALAALGIAQYVDVISIHSYPKGQTVLTGLGPRLDLADLAYAGKPVWISETGWTTYQKSGTGGHAATTEADAAVYGAEAPRVVYDHPRVEKAFRFELRDDPPAGISTNSEARFGLIRPDASWKPEATALKSVLAG